MNFILKIVAKLRKILEPFTWKKFQPKGWEDLSELENWDVVKEFSPLTFSKLINKLDYRWDKLQGLLDCSFPLDKPQYFFKDLKECRDCDDWARLWVIYYLYHGMEVQEWIVTNKRHPFTNSHFIAIGKESDGWHLLNYDRYSKGHETPEEALKDIEDWNSGNYAEDVRLQCLYSSYKPEVKDEEHVS